MNDFLISFGITSSKLFTDSWQKMFICPFASSKDFMNLSLGLPLHTKSIQRFLPTSKVST